MKKLNYVEIANNPVKTPRPYKYRDQIIRGRKYVDSAYSIGQILASYLELNGLSAHEFARRVTNFGMENYGYGVCTHSILQYIKGICKPKSEIRTLLADYLGMDESFITGYRRTSIFEGMIEERISMTANPGVKIITAPGKQITTRPYSKTISDPAA